MRFNEVIVRALDNWFVWAFLLAGNFIGTVMGFINYWPQMMHTTVYLWPFVPDCPLYTGLFCAFLILNRLKRNFPVFNFILFVGLIKFAFATWLIVASYATHYSPSLLSTNTFFGFLHIGMVVDAILVLPFSKNLSFGRYALGILWIFSNEFLDLVLGIYPWLPSLEFLGVLYIHNILMNIALTAVFIWLVRKR